MKKIIVYFIGILLLSLSIPFEIKSNAPSGSSNPLLAGLNEKIEFGKITAAHLHEAADSAIKRSDRILGDIIASKPSGRTFTNTLLPLDDLINILIKVQFPADLMTNVHPQKEVREAGTGAYKKLSEYIDAMNINEKLYKAILEYAATGEAKTLTGERLKFLKDALRDFKRSGFELTPALRDTLMKLNKQITDLTVDYNNNITADKTFLVFNEEQMRGMPEDFKKARRQADGTYKVDVSNPSYNPFLSYGKDSAARMMMNLARLNRAKEHNPELLKKLIVLRDKKAKLLGYKSFAAYEAEIGMSKTPAAVWEFEKKLAADVRVKAEKEYKELLAAKSKETGKPESVLYFYDGAYYTNIIQKEKYSVDVQKISEYFEMQNVIKGVFDLYQKLYQLTFTEDKSPSVWHPDVQAFTVFDAKTKEKIGYFYLDMYPRDDKYSHFAEFDIVPGRNGLKEKQLPVASLVCNFPKPAADKPSLLLHKDFYTLLHEFGHLIHALLSETELASYAGTAVPRDFVEAPSQIMENWAFDKTMLKSFSKHYKTGEQLPDEMVQKLIESQNIKAGLDALQQLFYGITDYTLYDGYDPNGPKSITDVVREVQNTVTMYPFLENTLLEASFWHFTGYGAKYYGYMWSLVYAQDMFSVFAEKGLTNPEAGARYRKEVLSKGGSNDPLMLVKNFLGREPNNKAFLRKLGLE